MASQNFTNLVDHIASGSINFGSDNFKILLVTSVPSEANLDAWVDRADVTNEVVAGGATGLNYVTGGADVSCSKGVLDTANNKIAMTFSCTNPAFSSSTITAVGGIIYKSTGTAATDLLISYVEFDSGNNVISSNGDFNINFSDPLEISA